MKLSLALLLALGVSAASATGSNHTNLFLDATGDPSTVEASAEDNKLNNANVGNDHTLVRSNNPSPPGQLGQGQDQDSPHDTSTDPPEFTVEQLPFQGVPSKEKLHPEHPTQGGGKPDNIPAQVDMTARTEGMTVGDIEGVQSRNGKIDTSALGPDLSKVSVLVFKGLGTSDNSNSNKPLVLKRVDVNVPRPKIWRPHETYGDLVGEDAQVWYGEEVGGGIASGMFMANEDGGLVGSIQDGIDTYAIETEYEEDSPGNWKAMNKYSAVKLADLPPEKDPAKPAEPAEDASSGLEKASTPF